MKKLLPQRLMLHSFKLDFASPVTGARQRHSQRLSLIVEIQLDGQSGFGEVSSLDIPNYFHEWSSGSRHLMSSLIFPRIMNTGGLDFNTLDWLVGNGATRFAIECALLDLHAKRAGVGLTEFMNHIFETEAYDVGAKMPFGVAVGAVGGLAEASARMETASSIGVRRVKIKVDGTDGIEVGKLDFRKYPLDIALDFNGSLSRQNVSLLADIDHVGLCFIEEPSAELDLAGYQRLAEDLQTRIFLDETTELLRIPYGIRGLGTALGIAVKPFRFGSVFRLNEALEILQRNSSPSYLGGVFESSIGRRYLMAFGAHKCFTDVGDMAPSNWYFVNDIKPALVAPRGQAYLRSDFHLGSDVMELLGHECGADCVSFG